MAKEDKPDREFAVGDKLKVTLHDGRIVDAKEMRYLKMLCRYLSKSSERDRKLFMTMVQKMAGGGSGS